MEELVTPYTGVWIEILNSALNAGNLSGVTSYTGVWIEIRFAPTPEEREVVTPYTGVWIEIEAMHQVENSKWIGYNKLDRYFKVM